MSEIDWQKDPQAMMRSLLFKQKGNVIVEDKTEKELPLSKSTREEIIKVVKHIGPELHKTQSDLLKEIYIKFMVNDEALISRMPLLDHVIKWQEHYRDRTYTKMAVLEHHSKFPIPGDFVAPDHKPYEATSDYKLVEFIDGHLKGEKKFFHKDKIREIENRHGCMIYPVMKEKFKHYVLEDEIPTTAHFDTVHYYLKVRLVDCEAKYYFTREPSR